MSKIRSKNTQIERIVFKELRKKKIYFKKHYNRVVGNPDIALPRKKKAIFIDGDFWHGYKFDKKKSRLPKVYWLEKIQSNIKRDKLKIKNLKKLGWSVLRIWEHELAPKNLDNAMKRIVDFINKK